MQGDADLFALVLEDEHVIDVRPLPQRQITVGPHIDKQSHPLERQLGQRALVVRRVDDDLAARDERGKAILEDDNLKIVQRDLGVAAHAARAQRAEARREKGPVVALRVVGDPLLAERVEAQLRHGARAAGAGCRR